MMLSYYDLVLGLIPIALVGISGLLYTVGIGLTIAVPAGALVAGGLITHGLFVRTPTPAPSAAVQERPAKSFAD